MSENNPFENIIIKTDEFRINDEIRKLEIGISKARQNITIFEYQIGKQENRIDEITIELSNRKNSFTEIAERCKIEWFRNTWMTLKPQNIIQEIKYWLS